MMAITRSICEYHYTLYVTAYSQCEYTVAFAITKKKVTHIGICHYKQLTMSHGCL